MGNCVSGTDARAEKARSDAIDKQIEEDSRKFRKECKILLLGEHHPSPLKTWWGVTCSARGRWGVGMLT
jgi:hypothetical protein